MTALFLLLAMLPGRDLCTRDFVDVTEVNHLHSRENGKPVLSQVIWWRWSYWEDAYRVVDWRLLPKAAHPERRGRGWVTRFYDEKTSRFRAVESKVLKVSWSIEDPELADRVYLPEQQRRKLSTREGI